MQKPAGYHQIWVYARDQIQKRTDIKYHGIVMMRMVLAWGMWTPLMTEDPTWGNASLPLITVVSGKYTDTLPPVETHKIELMHKNNLYIIYCGLMMLTFKLLSEQEQNYKKTSSFKTKTNSNGFKSWVAARLTTVVGAIWLGSDGFLAVLWSQGSAMPCHWPISFTFLLRGEGSLYFCIS